LTASNSQQGIRRGPEIKARRGRDAVKQKLPR
jgi:hypothetical protein